MKKFPIPGLVNCLCASLQMGQIKVDSSKKLMQAKEKHRYISMDVKEWGGFMLLGNDYPAVFMFWLA